MGLVDNIQQVLVGGYLREKLGESPVPRLITAFEVETFFKILPAVSYWIIVFRFGYTLFLLDPLLFVVSRESDPRHDRSTSSLGLRIEVRL